MKEVLRYVQIKYEYDSTFDIATSNLMRSRIWMKCQFFLSPT